jgi:glycerophosphoryl diester phosphodiesterase
LIELPQVIGHRGVGGLAPENTLAGFRAAARLGVAFVEFDIRLSADHRPVLMHDATIDRTTDGSGAVADLTLDEIAAHDAGRWFGPDFSGEVVPTLEEALDLLEGLGIGANIELKPETGNEALLAGAACRIIEEMGLSRSVLVSSFSSAALAAARAASPALPLGLLVDAIPEDWRAQAEAVGAATIHVRHDRLSRARVAEFRAAGYRVLAYTVNHAGRLRELDGWGVTSVFTDFPDRLAGFASKARSAIKADS